MPAFTRSIHDGGLSGDATGFYAATASSWPPGDACRGPCSRSTRSPRSPPPSRSSSALAATPDLATVARSGRALQLRARRSRRRALDEAERCRGVRLAARLGSADARLPRARLRHSASTSLVGLRLRAVARLCRTHRRRRRVSRPNATGRRWVGLLAAALLDGLAAARRPDRRPSRVGERQWEVDVGLHNYNEPLSTLLVTGGAAMLLSPRLTPMRLALAGCAFSVATP